MPTPSCPSHALIRAAKLLTRRSAILRLRTLSSPELARRSRLISDHARSLPDFRAARTIMLFAPMVTPDTPEVDLSPLALWCLAQPLTAAPALCLPRLDWSTKQLVPALLTDWSHGLVTGRFGVREPVPACTSIDPALIDLVFLPALAFDHLGNRLGRGGGFYDRFLASLSHTPRRIGVCFDRQLAPSPLPALPHDARVHTIITESRILSTT